MNESQEELEKLLKERDIQPTAIRLLVLRAMLHAKQSVSLLDLEGQLETIDKSTIFRTLTLFHAHKLIHAINDGTGSCKYALCQPGCQCHADEQHAHFHCVRCNRTFCFTNIPSPLVKLPDGFQLDNINYVLTGICAECALKE